MMTASGRKEEPTKGRVLDFSQVKVEDLSARKNLRSNFDLIFNEDMEKIDTGSLGSTVFLRKRDTIKTVWNGIKMGLIGWQDISFNKETVDHFLKSNKKLKLE